MMSSPKVFYRAGGRDAGDRDKKKLAEYFAEIVTRYCDAIDAGYWGEVADIEKRLSEVLDKEFLADLPPHKIH